MDRQRGINMSKSTEEKQKELASYTGRLLRDSFGKGPEAAYVTIGESHVLISLKGFMSPIEQQLLEDQGKEAVHVLRESMMKKIVPEVRKYAEELTGGSLNEFFYDWDMESRTGILVGLQPEAYQQSQKASEALQQKYRHREKIEQTIRDITESAERQPDHVASVRADKRTILVMRTGILVSIEKQLIEMGYERTLRIAKRELEKGMFHKQDLFADILGVPVRDIFVDWDFDNDKSMVVLVTDSVE